jgi:putative transposase
LWRAVDAHGAELDILLQKLRDKAAAKRCSKRVLLSGSVPRPIVAINCAGPAEQPGGEQTPTNTRTRASHAWLSRPEAHTRISLLLRTSLYRKQIAARFGAWRAIDDLAQNPRLPFERLYVCHPAVSIPPG